jgi:hypothetical protein
MLKAGGPAKPWGPLAAGRHQPPCGVGLGTA